MVERLRVAEDRSQKLEQQLREERTLRLKLERELNSCRLSQSSVASPSQKDSKFDPYSFASTYKPAGTSGAEVDVEDTHLDDRHLGSSSQKTNSKSRRKQSSQTSRAENTHA